MRGKTQSRENDERIFRKSTEWVVVVCEDHFRQKSRQSYTDLDEAMKAALVEPKRTLFYAIEPAGRFAAFTAMQARSLYLLIRGRRLSD